MPPEVFPGQRCHRVEHLHLLVADIFRLERDRRLHADERQHLEHVVLNHVAKRTRAIVVRAPRANPLCLRDRHLDVIDVSPVPDRLEDPVGEPERQDVLDGLLSEIVIDAIDLRFGETG